MKQDKLDKWVGVANAKVGNIVCRGILCQECIKELYAECDRLDCNPTDPDGAPRQFARDHLEAKGYDWRTGKRLASTMSGAMIDEAHVPEPLVRHDPIGTEGSVSQTTESETQELTKRQKLEQIKAGSCLGQICLTCPVKAFCCNDAWGHFRSRLPQSFRAEATRLLAEMDAPEAKEAGE